MKTTKYKFNAGILNLNFREEEKEKGFQIEILENDMFLTAKSEYKKGKSVCIHNFGNNFSPGVPYKDNRGNIYFKSNTQEEQLLRSTLNDNNHIILPLDFYPICENDENNALLTDNALFFRDKITGEILDSKNWYRASIITCPALQYPKLDENGKYLNNNDIKNLYQRMILCLFLSRNYDVFITGLWGCGSFKNSYISIFHMWKMAFDSVHLKPKKIIFCIYTDSYTEKNINIDSIKNILTQTS